MEKIENIDKVIEFLNLGRIVLIASQKIKTLAKMRNEKILIFNDNVKYQLDLDDFKALFKNDNFYLYHSLEKETIDFAKDEEYYRWKNK